MNLENIVHHSVCLNSSDATRYIHRSLVPQTKCSGSFKDHQIYVIQIQDDANNFSKFIYPPLQSFA
jgi:hypothetical protein